MKGPLPLLLISLGATGLFELFFHYDWDSGVVRGGLVVALLTLMLLAHRSSQTPVHPEQSRGRWPRWLLVAASLGAGFLLYWHFKEGIISTVRQRRSEMGDIHVRAVKLLGHGVTPWRFGTVLESGALRFLIQAPEVVACRTLSVTPSEAAQAQLWESERRGSELFPERINEPGCERGRSILAVVGYRYGPAMLAAYVPLVSVLGRGGEYVTHLVFLLAILGAMAVLLRPLALEGLVMACVIVLGQSVLRRDTLLDSDCDLIPTAMMLWALVAFEKGRSLTAGALTGLTLAAKVFPAVFLLPLLLSRSVSRGRALAGCALVSLITWGPALALDGVGVWDNVFRFNIERGGDSTALAHFVPPLLMTLLRLIIVAWCALAFYRLVLRPRAGPGEPLLFVAVCMGLFFLFTKVFHNNYVVWWLPVVGVTLARALTAPRLTARSAASS